MSALTFDIAHLLGALDAGMLRGAALDVLPDEPVPRDSRLLQDPRVILTPHAAFYSVEAERELRRKAAQNIVTWWRTGRPDYPVVQGTRKPTSDAMPSRESNDKRVKEAGWPR